jgi:hypothetical protein
MRLKLLAAACILVATATAPAAVAEEHILVLYQTQSAMEAHATILTAAEDACAAEYVRGAHRARDLRTCVRLTVDDAVAQSRRADLRALHESLSPDSRYAHRRLAFAAQ